MIEESQTRRPSRPRTLRSGVDHRHRSRAHAAGADGVMVGLAGAEGVVGQLLVGGEVAAGHAHGQQEGLQRRLPQDLARHPQALERHARGRRDRPSSWGRSGGGRRGRRSRAGRCRASAAGGRRS